MALFSIVLPVRNGMPFLHKTVRSVLHQTEKDYEFIIVDDGSTDGTTEYLKSINDKRVLVLRTEGLGIATALNYGIQKSTTKLIARMDADDVCHENRFEEQVKLLQTNKDTIVCGTQTRLIDENDNLIGKNQFPASDSAIRFSMLFQCPFQHPSVMMRREPLQMAGGYVQDEFPAEDIGLWFRLAALGKFANIEKELLDYRVHSSSVTSTKTTEQVEKCCKMSTDYAANLDPQIQPEAFRMLFNSMASYRIEETDDFHSLLAQYKTLKQVFNRHSNCIELDNVMKKFDRKLRGMLLATAKRSFPKLVSVAQILIARSAI